MTSLHSTMTPDELLDLVRDEAHQGDAVDGAEWLYDDPESWVEALETVLAVAEEHRAARARRLERNIALGVHDEAKLRRDHAEREASSGRFEDRLRERLVVARRAVDVGPRVQRRELLESLRAATSGIVTTARPHPEAPDDLTLVQTRRIVQAAEVLTAIADLDGDLPQLYAI